MPERSGEDHGRGGPGFPGQGEPAPELQVDQPLPHVGDVVHFRLLGPAGGRAHVEFTTVEEITAERR